MSRAPRMIGRALERLLELGERVAPGQTFRIKRHFYRPDMRFSLQLLRRSGFLPDVVIDVGAYVGEWSRDCRLVFPDARILMVEPWPARVDALRALCAKDARLFVHQALLSSSEGSAAFFEQESNSGIRTMADGDREGTVRIPTTTLDRLVADSPFERPALLKVDVQGHDLEVLIGAQTTLRGVEVVIVELSLIPLHPDAPTLRTATEWLGDRGFRFFDVAGLIRRPVNDELWQMDAVFVRQDSRLGAASIGW